MLKKRPESANLRAELARAGWTQQDVADLLGTWATRVSFMMKSGRWHPGDLDLIAEALGCPVEALDDRFVPPFYRRRAG